MLKKRLLWGSILIAISIALLLMDHLLDDNTGFTILMLVAVSLGLYEFYKMYEDKGAKIPKTFAIIMAAGTIIIGWSNNHLFPALGIHRIELHFDQVFLLFLLGLVFYYIIRDNIANVENLIIAVFGMIYICWTLNYACLLRGDSIRGESLFIYFVVVNKMADTFAYFVGSLWGRYKLAPKISPKKTVEGFIGGILGGALSGFVLWLIMKGLDTYDWYHIIVIGLCIAIAGQMSDLLASLFKRHCNKEHSLNIFPGLGGILDIIDSLILSAPVAYFLLIYYWKTI